MKAHSDRKYLALKWLAVPLVESLEKIMQEIEADQSATFISVLEKMRFYFDDVLDSQIVEVMSSYEKYQVENNKNTKQTLLEKLKILLHSLNDLTKIHHDESEDISLMQYLSAELRMLRDMMQIETEDYFEQAALGLAGLSKSLWPLSSRAGEAIHLTAEYLQIFNKNKMNKLAADARAVISRIIVATEIFVENLTQLGVSFDGIYDRVESDILWLSSNIQAVSKKKSAMHDPEIIEIFYEELKEEVDGIAAALVKLKTDVAVKPLLLYIKNAAHTIKGSALIMEAKNISAYAEEIESLLKKSADLATPPVDDIAAAVHAFCEALLTHLNTPHHPVDMLNAGTNRAAPFLQTNLPLNHEKESVDPEILAIFLDEAQDIMVRVELDFKTWQNDLDNQEAVADLHRELHTLKGGARMVGQADLADLAHELERLYNVMAEERTALSADDFKMISDCHDHIAIMLDALREGQSVASTKSLIQNLRAHFGLSADETSAQLAMKAQIKKQQDITIAKISDIQKEAKQKTAQEMVRVSAAELESLYHISGEVSASRANLVQNVTALNRLFLDVTLLTKRLNEQIRQLEIQTDLQRIAKTVTPHSDAMKVFDPLEFDRYSRMQQLTRGISETVSDILVIRDEQFSTIQSMDNGLQEQGKHQNELRSGLLRTQLVYFSSVFPRLKRIVKQTAEALNKKCELVGNNLDIEIDRNLLNHLLAPLEHMLRNSVDHGIEDPTVRVNQGKKEIGTITLSLRRDGGEFFIEISDDGSGISVENVRQKAIEKGLIKADESYNKSQILRLILNGGFSTKETITQISGRGVGLDVVYNEVKQLGGHFMVDTEEGKKTVFTLHLPFTQSLHRALIFKVEDETFLLQLSSIFAIARLDYEAAKKFIHHPGTLYEQGDERYAVIYCGNLLSSNPALRIPKKCTRYPLLLLRTRDIRLGLLVDEIEGSREVLLKSLNPELRPLRLLAGATELNEGKLSFILDPEGLAERAENLYKIFSDSADTPLQRQGEMPQKVKPGTLRILVVDDSMTVRRVTSRFLSTRGFKVETAKDGMDALAAMEKEKPDVVLIDVEMPRMDGFECVASMRAHPDLAAIPVIMITSRTAQKHRDHATSLGVRHYFGKPYQEEALFKAIMKLI